MTTSISERGEQDLHEGEAAAVAEPRLMRTSVPGTADSRMWVSTAVTQYVRGPSPVVSL